jgi:DNA anti-recombination protein RmuC
MNVHEQMVDEIYKIEEASKAISQCESLISTLKKEIQMLDEEYRAVGVVYSYLRKELSRMLADNDRMRERVKHMNGFYDLV